MSFLPAPDVDLSGMSKEELYSLKTHLEVQSAKAKARLSHIASLAGNVDAEIAKRS
ncbi:MAG: hypothetical protein AAF503_05880 [Pseudomonadota bacterium]